MAWLHKMIHTDIIFSLMKKRKSSEYGTPHMGFGVSPYISQCHSTVYGIQCCPDMGHPCLRWKGNPAYPGASLRTSSCVSCHIPARSGLRLGGPGFRGSDSSHWFTIYCKCVKSVRSQTAADNYWNAIIILGMNLTVFFLLMCNNLYGHFSW